MSIEPQDFLTAHQRAREEGFRVVSLIVGSPGRGRAIFHHWVAGSQIALETITAPGPDYASASRVLKYAPQSAALEIVPREVEFTEGFDTAMKISSEQPNRPVAVISPVAPIGAAVADKSIDITLQYSLIGGLVPLESEIAEKIERISGGMNIPNGYRSVHEFVLHALIHHDRSIDVSFVANRKVPGSSRKLYEIDLWCERLRLAIEVDGMQHFAPRQKRLDEVRDADLGAAGIKTQRILASALMSDPSKALMLVRETVDSRLREISR